MRSPNGIECLELGLNLRSSAVQSDVDTLGGTHLCHLSVDGGKGERGVSCGGAWEDIGAAWDAHSRSGDKSSESGERSDHKVELKELHDKVFAELVAEVFWEKSV